MFTLQNFYLKIKKSNYLKSFENYKKFANLLKFKLKN
jgi:hypothetical protein